MNFRPSPLLYGANEDFFSTFTIAVTMRFSVDCKLLSEAVEKAMKRYPYFSVTPKRQGEQLVLQFNSKPVPVFPDDRTVTLGTEQSNGHLLTFGCKENTIFLNASHFIADGMGINPLLYTVLYLYLSSAYGNEGIDVSRIRMPEDSVPAEEHAYPFPEAPIEYISRMLPEKKSEAVYSLNDEAFDSEGLYAYHLRIPQKAMMSKAHTSDGSPVSFLTVMLYRAISQSDAELKLPVVCHVQHQYRHLLKAPQSHHSLVNYIPVKLSVKAESWDIEKQNTAIRGQVILGSEKEADIIAVNHLLKAFPCSNCLADKQQAMAQFVRNSIRDKTFGISYVGKMDWCGMDKYVEDMHIYIGEKQSRNTLLIEVLTIDEDFSLTFMQSGKGEKYLHAFIEQLKSCDIPVSLAGERRYTLCDTRIQL